MTKTTQGNRTQLKFDPMGTRHILRANGAPHRTPPPQRCNTAPSVADIRLRVRAEYCQHDAALQGNVFSNKPDPLERAFEKFMQVRHVNTRACARAHSLTHSLCLCLSVCLSVSLSLSHSLSPHTTHTHTRHAHATDH